jgi:hypothetical protein
MPQLNRRTLLAGLASTAACRAASTHAATSPDLAAAAMNGWLYALPLIETAGARARATQAQHAAPNGGINRLGHATQLAGPTDRAITTPNSDTLYSSGFVDLTQGPVTLVIPDAGTRYQSVAIMDMYTNNNVVLGKRTPGGAAGTWRLLAPGTQPTGPKDLVIATPHAWVLGRTLVLGPADLAAARAVQQGLALSGPATPPPPLTAPRLAPWPDYFHSALRLAASDPPSWLAGLAAFEQVQQAGRLNDFSAAGYSPADAAAIAAGVARAQALVRSAAHKKDFIQGWAYPRPDLGQFADDYVFRAIVAVAGLAALPRQEAMYMNAQGDGAGLFTGDGLYRLHLAERLPVDGFWSLTMYEATPQGQFFLTENPLHRYNIGDRTPNLLRSPDGSLDIWISRTDPGGDRTRNWLPAPAAGPFACTLRTYLPHQNLRAGHYRLPPIERV